MKRITKNRLKEKQKYISCYVSCADESMLPQTSVSINDYNSLNDLIDACDGKPGVKLSDTLSSESWTDILFSDTNNISNDNAVSTTVTDGATPELTADSHQTINNSVPLHPTSNASSIISTNCPKLAANIDERNPLFQFLSSSPVFRAAVYSALNIQQTVSDKTPAADEGNRIPSLHKYY